MIAPGSFKLDCIVGLVAPAPEDTVLSPLPVCTGSHGTQSLAWWVHTFNLRRLRQGDLSEFEASLIYVVNSRYIVGPCLKKKKKSPS